jgi:hypothetical protein
MNLIGMQRKLGVAAAGLPPSTSVAEYFGLVWVAHESYLFNVCVLVA